VHGLDALARGLTLAPDDSTHFNITSSAGPLIATVRLSLSVSVPGAHVPIRSLVVGRFSRVRIITRWCLRIRAADVLASPELRSNLRSGARKPGRGLRPTISAISVDTGGAVYELQRSRAPRAARPGSPAGWVFGSSAIDADGPAVRGSGWRDRLRELRPPWQPLPPPPPTLEPGFVWRLVSFAVGSRVSAVLAREIEGALLWQLRQLQ